MSNNGTHSKFQSLSENFMTGSKSENLFMISFCLLQNGSYFLQRICVVIVIWLKRTFELVDQVIDEKDKMYW